MIRSEILKAIDDSELDYDEVCFLMDRLCRSLVSTEESMRSRVSIYLRAKSSLEKVNREEVASHFFMSSRTLSRKLNKENSAFHKLLNEERKRRCKEYLSCNITSAPQLTELLGLSDLSHFYKAFKQWTGHRFSEYKKNMAESQDNVDSIFHIKSY